MPLSLQTFPKPFIIIGKYPLAINLKINTHTPPVTFNYLLHKNDGPTFAHLVENRIQQTVTAPGADLLTRYLPTSVSLHTLETYTSKTGRAGWEKECKQLLDTYVPFI